MRPQKLFICLAVIVAFILTKVVWVWCYCADNGTFESEKQDILERSAYLIDKVITSPENLLDEMPSAIGPQFQGEWALYTCSMLTAALENISRLYPETKDESIGYIDSLIHIVLSSEIREYDRERWGGLPVKGSYSALNCYYLTLLDEEFAKEQYDRLKDNYLKKFPFTGFKEYNNRYCLFGVDIDAGPIIFNLSPSGTAFATGSVTYFNDSKLRRKLLKTAEIAGTTISCRGKRHYLLADVALVGEAIMLAMRTNVNM